MLEDTTDYLLGSNSKFRTILRRFSDRPDYQKLLIPIGVRLSGASFFEFGIADLLGAFELTNKLQGQVQHLGRSPLTFPFTRR